MQRSDIIAGLVAILVAGGLGYAAWRYVGSRSSETCRACARPVHAHSRTIALVDGKRTFYCCPACALSEHQQSGKPVRVTALTDFLGGGLLKPESSYVVWKSDVNPCLPPRPAVGENSQPLESHFDRCAPSVLAFTDRTAANAFTSRHGGQVVRFADFAAEFQR